MTNFPKFRRFTQADKDNVISAIKFAYETEGDTMLKKMLLQKIVGTYKHVKIEDWVHEFPEKMLVDFAKALMKHHAKVPDSNCEILLPSTSFFVKIEES